MVDYCGCSADYTDFDTCNKSNNWNFSKDVTYICNLESRAGYSNANSDMDYKKA